MFTDKPSCIKELKRLANDLISYDPIDESICIHNIRKILALSNLTDKEKLVKIKEICKEYVK